MTDRSELRRAFEDHDAFEDADEGYRATATPFEARVTLSGDDPPTFLVTVRVPTLPAAVDGEVGDAVADGWFDTLAIRLEDAYDVTRAAEGDLDVRRTDGLVRVDLSFTARPPRTGVDDAAALVDFVEGTYVQGVIPGYDYEPPVSELIATARQRGRGEGP